MRKRNRKLAIWSLILVFSACWWSVSLKSMPHEYIYLGGDSTQYIILSESIAHGQGYKALNYPQSPPSGLPPFLPLLIAPIVYFFGRNFFLMHMLIAGCAYFSLFFFYKIFKEESGGERIAFFSIIILALSKLFFSYTFRILTEIPFVFLCSFTLYFLERYKQKEKVFSKEGILASVGLVLTYLCRYIGIVFFLAAIFGFLLEKKERKIQVRKIFFLTAIFLPIVLLWMVRDMNINNPYLSSFFTSFLYIDGYRPYLGFITQSPLSIINRIVHSVNIYFYVTGEIIFSSFFIKSISVFLIDLLGLLGIIVIFLGIKEQLRRHQYLLPLSLSIYSLFLILWPYYEDGRYILPVLPLIIFYFLVGMKKILSFLPQKISRFCFYGTVLLLLIFNTISLPLKGRTFKDLPSSLKHFISCNIWAKQNLPSQGLIFSRKPRITYFYTNHKSICYPFTLKPDKIWEEAKNNNVKYIIVDEFSRETYYYIAPFICEYKNRLKLLYRMGNTGLLEVIQ